jgi:Flp pilus assembly pilin Flp
MNFSFGTFREFFLGQEGQDVAEYAIMMAVVLVIVMGTVTAIASNAGVVFSGVASSIP